jgi:AcrR family transcriptional regulator
MKTSHTKTQKLTEMRRNQILIAATDVFANEGYEKANTDEIAKIAGLGKGTLYRYFKSKEDLFLSVVQSNFIRLADTTLISIKSSPDPVKQIECLITGFLSFFDKNPKFRKIMIQVHEQSSIHKRIANIMCEHYFSEMKKLEEIIKTGIKLGSIKNINPEKAISILMSILSGILHMHIFYKKKQKLMYNAPVVLKIFFTGIIRDNHRRVKYE